MYTYLKACKKVVKASQKSFGKIDEINFYILI